MRIKIPLFEFETDKNCPCKDQNEYELKIKCMKTKLHSIYIACIATGIVIWSLATGKANNAEFSSWISFASTITSIILSVIAIFMSISGESKTDSMRDKMEEASKKLEKTANDIEAANKESIKNLDELKREMDELKVVLVGIPGETAQRIQTALFGVEEVNSINIKNGKGWLNSNGK